MKQETKIGYKLGWVNKKTTRFFEYLPWWLNLTYCTYCLHTRQPNVW